jgi:hypothetical protein
MVVWGCDVGEARMGRRGSDHADDGVVGVRAVG